MDRLRKASVLTRLIDRLGQNGSWCGETHIQKVTFFVQDLMSVPLGFDFILYKHGPFSFDLRDELTSLLADELIKLEPQSGYGPRISTTERSRYIQGLHSKTLEKYDSAISFITDKLRNRGVADLERLAMALYVTQHLTGDVAIDARAARLNELKHHVPRDEAAATMKEVDRMIAHSKH